MVKQKKKKKIVEGRKVEMPDMFFQKGTSTPTTSPSPRVKKT